jgi:hypothetical protein
MSEKDIMIVSRKWPRRGNYTSVERFLDYFPEARIISSGNSDPKPYRLWHSIAGPVNRSAYSNWSALLHTSKRSQAQNWRLRSTSPTMNLKNGWKINGT